MLQAQVFEIATEKRSSAKDRTATGESGGRRDEAGDAVPFHSENALSKYRVFCGDVEFGAVSAELDFVNAFMETVSNDFVYDEIFIIVSKKRGRKIV